MCVQSYVPLKAKLCAIMRTSCHIGPVNVFRRGTESGVRVRTINTDVQVRQLEEYMENGLLCSLLVLQ